MRSILPYTLIAVAVTACNSHAVKDIPVPRPAAYHRITLPDSTYRTTDAGLVSLQLNAATNDTIVTAGNSWITSHYPDLGTSVYITVNELSPSSATSAIDNRVERLSLNTGGNPTEVSSFTTPAGLDAKIIVTPSGTPTPVQFIATDHASILVSGTATVADAATAPTDSLLPVINMLQRDITHLLKTIQLK